MEGHCSQEDMMDKLCYVLPEYNAKTDEHFLHTYSFLEKLGSKEKVSVLIEKAVGVPRFNNITEVYVQNFKFMPLRIIELLMRLLSLRLKGYKKLYVHYSFMPAILGSIIFRLTGGKVYYWNCGLAADYFLPWAFKGENIKKKFDSEIPLRTTLRTVNFLVTGTDRMAEYYKKKFGLGQNKIIVIPNDIDLSKYKIRKKEHRGKTVLFLHRLSNRKGAQYLPDIAKKVLRRVPEVKFLIAGDGPLRHDVEEKVRGYGLSEKVKFLGAVPNKDAQRYFSMADVFIMPSDEEGFPRVLLESMALGVPFVATNVGGVLDIIPENEKEFIVGRGDVGLFVEKIISLLSDKKKQRALALESRKHVERFNTPVILGEFINKIMK
jgi:glycosyltransferase involved in cell wall biosynthesis